MNEIWIRSQDKKILVKADSIRLKTKVNVLFRPTGQYVILASKFKVGFYSSEQKALKVMYDIQEHLQRCETLEVNSNGLDMLGRINTPSFEAFQMPLDNKVE